ncbi:MAG: Zn-ribbon domain-containing OB-fold protein [Thermoplasmata archaeon]|nr:Zn-ribbon domain-containing OB-fold protein [Thermoplasmata archaeon]
MVVPRFWRERRHRYSLIGTRCPVCGTVYFPPRNVCPKCGRKSLGKMEEFQLSGKGKIYSYTIVHQNVLGYKYQKPYIMAIIETPEGPKITAQIVDIEPEEVHIGMPVRAVFRRITEDGKAGIIQYGYKFVPDWEELEK